MQKINVEKLDIPFKYKIQYMLIRGSSFYVSNNILFREIIKILFEEGEYESFITPNTYREIVDFLGLLEISFTVTSNSIYDKITVTRLIS